MKPIEGKRRRNRILWVGALFFSCFIAIIAKAVYLQVPCSPWLASRAAGQYEKTLTVHGKRGAIYDANMRELALSTDATSIAAYPKQIENPREMARDLARDLNVNRKDLAVDLASGKPFVWIKRQVTPKERESVMNRSYDGIDFLTEHSRFYPNRHLAAQVIGFTGVDGNGLEGLEFRYDAALRGREKNLKVIRDALGKNFDGETADVPNSGGNSLILTIDRTVQYIAEKAVEEAALQYDAKSCMALVMVPGTGAILAMANYPFFNPNAFHNSGRERWRNRAVTDPFEPGSTMKIFTASAAIDFGGCTPSTIFFCENGKYQIGEDIVHDTRPYGWLSLEKIIKYSSNIGAIKLSEMVGPSFLYQTLVQFGFGSKTGIDCPGETAGSLKSPDRWTRMDTSAIAFGHGISVSAIQLITAVSAIANDGVRMKPYIVQAVMDPTGRYLETRAPEAVGRAISAQTARIVKAMMRSVVMPDGTGRHAALEDYSVCGKTGTARKVDDSGQYMTDAHLASFVGFVPYKNPQLAILVVIDEPRGNKYYGGAVAAPVFKKIARESLSYLNIPPQPVMEQLTAFKQSGRSG